MAFCSYLTTDLYTCTSLIRHFKGIKKGDRWTSTCKKWSFSLWRIPLKGDQSASPRATVGILQLLSMFILMMPFVTGEVTTGWAQGSNGLMMRWTWAKTPSITSLQAPKLKLHRSPHSQWILSPPPWLVGPEWHFWSPGNSISSEPMSGNPRKVWVFPFSQGTVILATDHRKGSFSLGWENLSYLVDWNNFPWTI